MQKKVFKKTILVSIILLFIAAVFIPVINGDNKNLNNQIETINILHKNENLKVSSIQEEKYALFLDTSYSSHPTISIKGTLCRNNWKEENIITIINENTTKNIFLQKLSLLSTYSTENDIVLIYIVTDGSVGRFHIHENEYMTYWRLNLEINKIKAKAITIVIDTCHSGSAIPFLKKENRIIITACKQNELTVEYDARFNLALQGFSDYEGNNDDLISVEEIFNYTLEETIGLGTPQIQDDYPGELILSSVNHSFIEKNNIDIYHNHPYNGNAAGYDYFAQSFKSINKKITKIMLLCRRKGDKPLDFSIRKNLNGENLTDKTVTLDIFSDTTFWHNRFFEIDFPDIIIEANTTYYIVCKIDYLSNWFTFGIDSYDYDEYKNGKYYHSNDGISWHSEECMDLIFIVFSEDVNNSKPNKPLKPSGINSGNIGDHYFYETSTIDDENDKIYYLWDWSDGSVIDWIGPFDSGQMVSYSHNWTDKGYYKIKVRAMDEHGVISSWSDPFKVTMPRTTGFRSYLLKFFERFPNMFLILQHLLGL